MVYSMYDSFCEIGSREPLVREFPQCVNVLRLMIVQCGGDLMCPSGGGGAWPKNCRIIKLLSYRT